MVKLQGVYEEVGSRSQEDKGERGEEEEEGENTREGEGDREDEESMVQVTEVLDTTSIVRGIADKIRSLPHLQFSIMMDGTRDQSGKEREALCLSEMATAGKCCSWSFACLELETLNVSLQCRTQTIDGMLSAVACVKETFAKKKRNPDSFGTIHTKALQMCETFGPTPIASPCFHRPPQRFTGCAPAHVHASPSEYYRTEFYKVLDVVDMQIRERFEQEGMRMIRNLEQVLLTGEVHDVVQKYPELNPECLKTQLGTFRTKYNFQSSSDVGILQGMFLEVRGLFDRLETLVRLLIVVPVSSAEAERGFSVLRRLKTWLRCTMTCVMYVSCSQGNA
ncbi:uncharacterized protein LOC122980496 [Thunnus albacares]|uniref:uncharacterized protein LOC122980496 n=1 Tax=Thunnus albacares TaxID=8236 RepID=UPI001CF6A886|nr:uncharacterized protein LOC122980496 [Thunnus albacares]